MQDKKDLTALTITICAVITAMPRWIGALLASEGFIIPENWRPYWLVLSVVLNAAMAITEGAAFAYVFHAWRNQKDKAADKLLWFAGLSGLTFIIVLAPFIASQVRSKTLNEVLQFEWALWTWSIGVAASTIVIVASVGYAQKKRVIRENLETKIEPKISLILSQENSNESEVSSEIKKNPQITLSGRQLRILETIKEGSFSTSNFAKEKGLTYQTIYNDIKLLEKENLISKNGKGWLVN